MPSKPVEIARAAYDAWNTDQWDAASGFMHPEIEWRTSGLFPGFEPVYRGPEGVRAFWDAMKEAWEYFTIDIEEVFEDSDKAVIAVRFEAVGKESGVKVELRFAHVWEVREGLVVRYSAHADLDEALEVAGLPRGAP